MDLDNPVIAKLFEKAFGERLEQQVAVQTQQLEQKLREVEWLAQRMTEAEASARREAETVRRQAEVEATNQWQDLMLKVLEHRFQSVPVALILLLQAVKPTLRGRVSDLFLDSANVEECLQGLRQLTKEEQP